MSQLLNAFHHFRFSAYPGDKYMIAGYAQEEVCKFAKNSHNHCKLFTNSKCNSEYSSLALLQCLKIRNAAYCDTVSISQLLQSSRNFYWTF